jgi:hypothetical protein
MPTKTPTKPPEEQPTQDAIAIPTDDTPAAIIERRVKLTDTSMVISEETTFEESVSLYDFIDKIRERGRWWLGDLVSFMEGKFPDKYTQAIELTGLSYSRLTTVVSVCQRIAAARRRPEASFSMHELIAYLPYQSGDHLLDRAIKERWTHEELAAAVARSKGEPTAAEKRAAREAKKLKVGEHLPDSAKSPGPIVDEVKPLMWNGYPLTTTAREVYQGQTKLDEREANQAAHHFKFAHAPAMMNWLEEHKFFKGGDELCAQPLNVAASTGSCPDQAQPAPSTEQKCASNGAAPNATESAPTPQIGPSEKFQDFPLLVAKRQAFDSPTQANLEALICAAQSAVPASSPEAHKATLTPPSVADEILAIMATYHEQEERGDIDTPGGLEHMGDVWRLLQKWEKTLRSSSNVIPSSVGVITEAAFLEMKAEMEKAVKKNAETSQWLADACKELEQAKAAVAATKAPPAPATPLEAAELAIAAFNEASMKVDWKTLGKLESKKWLSRLLVRVDEVIDLTK